MKGEMSYKSESQKARKLELSSNLIQGFLGIAFMTIWLILSVQQDHFLLNEIIPAYIIITALLFMRALDSKH